MKTEANLCTCNNCGNIFIDQNPQFGAKVFNVNLANVSELQFLKDNSSPKSEIDGYEYFWGCGICETDGYLKDDVDELQAKKLGIIN